MLDDDGGDAPSAPSHTDPRRGPTLSPTLATTFLGCRLAASWELARRDATLRPPAWSDLAEPGEADELAALVLARGQAHERGVLDALMKGGEVAVIVDGAPDPQRRAADMAATHEVMARGVPFIHQAALGHGRRFGYADFLRRVEHGCQIWAWSYEPWDAKLSSRPRPSHLLQQGYRWARHRPSSGSSTRCRSTRR